MDKQESWKRTDEIEIDLMDLLRRVCGQWKRIVLCAAACAVLLGGYGWMKGTESTDAEAPAALEDVELTEDEQKAVEDAVQMQSKVKGLERYLENSVLMQIDPYHKNKVILLYGIDGAKRQELAKITESYLNFTVNGGAVDALIKSGNNEWKMDKSCLAELITAYQKNYSFPYQVMTDSQTDSRQTAESLFYIEITGKDAMTAKKMAVDIQHVLEKYSMDVKKVSGQHSLILLSSEESLTTDSGLLGNQRDKKALLTSNRTNLKQMLASFSKAQMSIYKEYTGIQEEEIETNDTQSWTWNIKYILFGGFAGVFLYFCIYFCCYVFSSKIKSTQEMKERYTFPVYGEISLKNLNSGLQKNLDFSRKEARRLFNRIKLACQKHGIKKLCVASDFAFTDDEKAFAEFIVKQLENCGIHAEIVENVNEHIDLWDNLVESEHVFMMCKIGKTTYRMIDDAMNFYLDNEIMVIGAAAFIQN